MPDAGDPHRAKRLTGQVLVILGITFAALAAVGMLAESGTGITMEVLVAGLLGALVMCGIPVVIGAYLIKRAGPAPPTPPGEKKGMTALRIIFASFAVLQMLFSGGCGLLFAGTWLMNPSQGAAGDWMVVGMFSIPPFLAGMLIWWLAVKVGR